MGTCCHTGSKKLNITHQDPTIVRVQNDKDSQVTDKQNHIKGSHPGQTNNKEPSTHPEQKLNINHGVSRDPSSSSEPLRTLTPIESEADAMQQNPPEASKSDNIKSTIKNGVSVIDQPPTGDTKQSSDVRQDMLQGPGVISAQQNQSSNSELPDQIREKSNLPQKNKNLKQQNQGESNKQQVGKMRHKRSDSNWQQRQPKDQLARVSASALGVNAILNDNICCC